jgi:DNA repair exonuclease SbcCD ATPase subunit
MSRQCYVGNTLHGPDQFPDSDCSQACAGDGTQACGEAGRIQVYEDLTWKNPTIDELAAAVERYNATMEDARAVIASYQGHVNELEELLQSQSSRKRQAQQLEELEMKVRKDYSDVEAVRAREGSYVTIRIFPTK